MSKAATTGGGPPPSLVCAIGSETTVLQDDEIRHQLYTFLNALGSKEDVMIVPPDFTRFHSQSGKITRMIAEYYNFIKRSNIDEDDEDGRKENDNITTTTTTGGGSDDDTKNETTPTTDKEQQNRKKIPTMKFIPALGTHAPMTKEQIKIMFGDELASKNDPNPFLVHDWRNDVVTIGHAPSEMVSQATHGMVNKPWPAQLNKVVWEKRHTKGKSVVLSIGQVVPHEVMGMANFNKNMFVGIGGLEAINLSHFIGAVHGMEQLMGKANNPLRSILNHASEQFLGELDLWYILTVMGTNPQTGIVEMRGLYIGNTIECYNQACELSLKVNFTMLETAPTKMVVYLDGDEFHSTWLGNKAIYRTRMAMADGGDLIILAPGVHKFGEDKRIDELIRKYGYVGTPTIMKAMEENEELRDNLSAVAHLIHGSSEGRFTITYCPGHLTKEEVEGVGFRYASLDEMNKKYDITKLQDGWHKDEDTGEDYFFVKNPALGLWAHKSRFVDDEETKKTDNSELEAEEKVEEEKESTKKKKARTN